MDTPHASPLFIRRLHGDPVLIVLGHIRAIWSRIRKVQDGSRRRMFVGTQELIVRISPPGERRDIQQELGVNVDVHFARAIQKLIFHQTGIMFSQRYCRRMMMR